MAKTKAKTAKLRQKKASTCQKKPLRAKICGVRTNLSKWTQNRDKKRLASPNEVLVAKAISAMREKWPHTKHFGRQKVYNFLKGKLSMGVIARLLSPKRARAFQGKDKVYSETVKRHWEEAVLMRAAGCFVDLSQNTACRVSRKQNWS